MVELLGRRSYDEDREAKQFAAAILLLEAVRDIGGMRADLRVFMKALSKRR